MANGVILFQRITVPAESLPTKLAFLYRKGKLYREGKLLYRIESKDRERDRKVKVGK